MNIINHTSKTLSFKMGSVNVTLGPGEIFPFNGFRDEQIKEVKKLLNAGLVTFYDDEDDELPEDLIINRDKSKYIIQDEGVGIFKNINFDKSILE